MERLGLPSVKAARAALLAHRAVQKGDPIRAAVADALAEAKALGGKERRFVAVAVRGLSRHLRRIDAAARSLGHPPGEFPLEEDRALVRWVLWRRLFTGAEWKAVGPEVRLPGPLRPRTVPDRLLEAVAVTPLPPGPETLEPDPVERAAAMHSFPNWLSRALGAQVGEARVDGLFAALNEEPDLFLRVRPPGTRDEVRASLAAEGVQTEGVPWAPDALRVDVASGMKVFDSKPMRDKRLQVQEPGSQLIAALCVPRGGDGEGDAGSAERVRVRRAVDYCAGAGGKTLGLADLVGKGGVVEAHDRSARRLGEARRRVKAWSLSQVRFAADVDAAVKQADVVLVDAPCSGTGSLGREPEQKWRLSLEKVRGFAKTQREILEDVSRSMKPGARLVYATCSLLREENEDVVAAFAAAHPEWRVESAAGELAAEVEDGGFLRVWPDRVRAGGFFAARLVRRDG